MGTPAIAIHVTDATKKICNKIIEKHMDQQLHIARQSECLTATVSHEMRTPLGTSLFFIQMLIKMLQKSNASGQAERSESDSEKALHYLQLVQSQLNFIMSFVNDLLDLRQLRDKVFSLVSETLDPNEILDDLINIFKPQSEMKGLSICWSIDRSLSARHQDQLFGNVDKDCALKKTQKNLSVSLPTCNGDARRLKQVLINLVRNAIKFTQEGGIEIRANYDNEANSLVV